jgi:hypothetical protein
MPASRSVVSVLLRSLGDFSLHPSARQRHDGHGEPASRSAPGRAEAVSMGPGVGT